MDGSQWLMGHYKDLLRAQLQISYPLGRPREDNRLAYAPDQSSVVFSGPTALKGRYLVKDPFFSLTHVSILLMRRQSSLGVLFPSTRDLRDALTRLRWDVCERKEWVSLAQYLPHVTSQSCSFFSLPNKEREDGSGNKIEQRSYVRKISMWAREVIAQRRKGGAGHDYRQEQWVGTTEGSIVLSIIMARLTSLSRAITGPKARTQPHVAPVARRSLYLCCV